MRKSNLYVLGSCRAFDLARESAGSEFLLQNRDDSFYHSTKEILNIIDYKRRKKIPKEYFKYLLYKSHNVSKISEADIIIIEVSSFYCAKIDDFYFKLHSNNLSKFKYRLSKNEVNKDLKEILYKLRDKKIILIPNLNCRDNDKVLIPSRNQMAVLLKNFAEANKAYFFDPSIYMTEHYLTYVDEAIYHYTPYGRKHIGAKFREFLEKINAE